MNLARHAPAIGTHRLNHLHAPILWLPENGFASTSSPHGCPCDELCLRRRSLRFSYAEISTSSTHPPSGCPQDEPCLRSRRTPQSPMECAIPATHPPYSCPHDETRLNAPTAQFPARWNPSPRACSTVAHAARSLRRARLTVARGDALVQTYSPRSCPRDEIVFDQFTLRLPAQ